MLNNVITQGTLPGCFIKEEIKKHFDDLQIDSFMNEGDNYRYRAFGTALYEHGAVSWQSGTRFYQGSDINKYKGGVDRSFAAIHMDIKDFVSRFIEGTPELKAILANSQSTDIGCHQIRIKTKEGSVGHPAPEGFHKDGFDYIAILSVARNNICGGITFIKARPDEPIQYEGELSPGSYIILKDDEVFHYTSPIVSRYPDAGYRDVIVLTFKQHH